MSKIIQIESHDNWLYGLDDDGNLLRLREDNSWTLISNSSENKIKPNFPEDLPPIICDLLNEAVDYDNADKKQWYLEKIAERLNVPLRTHKPGVIK